jgi:hypothetical protein
MKTLALFALIAVGATAAALPAGAQSAGVSALQYYVGTWACTGGPPGKPQSKATITYTLDSGILHSTIAAPKQNGMTQPYLQSSSTTYDAKNNRYIAGGVSNDPMTFTSAWTLSGNVETSRDLSVSSGKPGHGTTVRNSSSMFTYTGYPTMTSTRPSFKATCRKSS